MRLTVLFSYKGSFRLGFWNPMRKSGLYLTGLKLAEVVCSCARPLAKFD